MAGAAVFQGAVGVSLVYAARSRGLSVDPPTEMPSTLPHLVSLKMEGLLEDGTQTLYQQVKIAERKLRRLQRCLAWVGAALACWVWVLLVSLVP